MRIIQLWNRNGNRDNTEKQTELLQLLVINEMVEFWSPVCYLLCFITAYLGPNAELIGDVRNGYWQFKSITDVERTITYVSSFLFIDLVSLIISIILLWKLCRINLYKVYGALLKEFGFGFSANLAISFNLVRKLQLYNVNLPIVKAIKSIAFYFMRHYFKFSNVSPFAVFCAEHDIVCIRPYAGF